MKTTPLSLALLASALPAFVLPAFAQTPPPPPSAAAKPAPAKAADADDDDAKTYPAQSSVAAKTTFGTVPASDKSVTDALSAKDLAGAAKLVGKPGSFQGTVASVYSPKTHGFVALDFAEHYKDALTASIAPADYAKLPDLKQLTGKHVLVSGKFAARGSQTQIDVTSPDQIKIVP